MAKPWYIVDDINEIDSPALLVYKKRVQHNIALAIQMAGNASRLRPHGKTHKSPQVVDLMLQAGIGKFKCATIAEAEMIAQCNVPDVLLAYQPTGPKIKRLLKLTQHYPATQFSCLIDSIDAAQAIAKEAADRNLELNVFIDVNIGMNRTGVLPKAASLVYETCKELNSINVIGLHGYDGHINDTDLATRKQRADDGYGQLEEVREVLQGVGLVHPTIVVGGSPTFIIHAEREGVECSPGTFVYWDKSYEKLFPDTKFLPAVLVISRVVSILNEKRFCLDLGHKSIAAENLLNRRVHFINAEGLQIVSQSEEHLVVETSEPKHYKVGDIFYGMPFHVCPTCALYDTAYVIENGNVTEEWQMTARDRKIFV